MRKGDEDIWGEENGRGINVNGVYGNLYLEFLEFGYYWRLFKNVI